MILRVFKSFADFVNRYRPPQNQFGEILQNCVTDKSGPGNTILEVGCNLRPLTKKQNIAAILHGLDPDQSIHLNEAQNHFHSFFNTSFENFSASIPYDLIIFDMVFEHIEDNRITISKVNNLLKPGGICVIHCPNKHHPYAVVNRMINHKVKLFLLKLLKPWSKPGEVTGWRSYYDYSSVAGIRHLAKKENLRIHKIYAEYNAADYFAFFPPLFLLIVLFEDLMRHFKIDFFCASFIILLKKGS